MIRLAILVASAAAASPALALQSDPNAGQSQPAAAPAQAACAPEHAAMGHCTPPSPPPAPTPAPAPAAAQAACAPEHAAMGHCTLPVPEAAPAPPPPPCAPEHAAMGHCTLPPAGERAAGAHSGHGGAGTAIDPPVGPAPPQALSGPEHAADLFWDPRAMADARRRMRREHGGLPAYRVLVDQLEARMANGPDGLRLEADAWMGGDIDKAWFKAEAKGDGGGGFEEVDLQALWSHAVDPWFDVQAGVRYDLQPGSDRGHLVAGVRGLLPYWIELDAAAFLSDRGDVTASIEAEHDTRITQRLILQPRVDLELALQDVPEERLGAGLSELSLGARLRYQFRPEFAPYVGLSFDRAMGGSRRFRRRANEDPGGLSLVAGIRTWF